MTVLREDVDPTVNVEGGSIDIKDEAVLDSINRGLAFATARGVITPYIALEKVRKVLAYYKIFLPQTNFLEGDEGQEVFAVSQFGLKYGMTNDGEIKDKKSDDLHVYFEWSMNDLGLFDIYCEVVNNEELEELVAAYNEDSEDEGKEDSSGAKTSFDTYRASNMNEEFEEMEEDYDFRAKQDAEDNAAIAKRARKPSEKAFWKKAYNKNRKKAVTGLDEAKKDKPPFEGGYKIKGPRKDRFGNIIKTKNIAKHLAKKAEKKFVKEDNINEISTGLARNYLKKNAASKKKDEAEFYKADWLDLKNKREGTGQPAKSAKNAKKSIKTLTKRAKGETMAKNKLLGTAKVLTKEERLDELSKGLLRRYAKKASWSAMAAKFDDDPAKARHRSKGLKQAGDRLRNTMMVKKKYLAKEETINEISAEKAEKAYQKTMKKMEWHDSVAGVMRHGGYKDSEKRALERSAKLRKKAVKFADYVDKKSMKEETINEISTKKAQEYIQKNSDQRWKNKLTTGQTKKRIEGSRLAKKKLLGIAKVATNEDTLNELTYQKVRNAYDKAKKQGKHEKAGKFKKYSEKKDELQARYDDLEYKGD